MRVMVDDRRRELKPLVGGAAGIFKSVTEIFSACCLKFFPDWRNVSSIGKVCIPHQRLQEAAKHDRRCFNGRRRFEIRGCSYQITGILGLWRKDKKRGLHGNTLQRGGEANVKGRRAPGPLLIELVWERGRAGVGKIAEKMTNWKFRT